MSSRLSKRQRIANNVTILKTIEELREIRNDGHFDDKTLHERVCEVIVGADQETIRQLRMREAMRQVKSLHRGMSLFECYQRTGKAQLFWSNAHIRCARSEWVLAADASPMDLSAYITLLDRKLTEHRVRHDSIVPKLRTWQSVWQEQFKGTRKLGRFQLLAYKIGPNEAPAPDESEIDRHEDREPD